jgi:small subunit ribosomal protein S16
MSVKIRLTRAGAKKAPFYHIIATDGRSKRDGAYLENLGSYDPTRNPAEIKLNQERVSYWLKVGAQPSETVASLIKKASA